MKTFTLEEITQITGGMLTKVQDVKISQIAPPLLSDENTLALALGEEEIANLAKSKAKAPCSAEKYKESSLKVHCPRSWNWN